MGKKEKYLSNAMNMVFENTNNLGFWDEKNNLIHSSLICTKDWKWSVSQDTTDRYGLFTITLILLAHQQHNLDITPYKSKILSYLLYIKKNILNFKKSEQTYGALNALILGQILFGAEIDFRKEINKAVKSLKQEIQNITNNEDSLFIIGLSLFYMYVNKDESILLYVEKLVKSLLKCQDINGFFLTGDIRAVYHQRTMYTLWGLAFASNLTHKDEIRIAIEKTLNYIWENRRDGTDNAFLWHPKVFNIKPKGSFPIFIPSVKSADYLFECHQTFYANAVSFYQYFYNSTLFTHEKKKAIDWIFGENRLNRNLVEVTEIGIPARIMSRKGKLYIKKNNFKGSYEVGSYIYTLASF